jgi:hypothetical protein
MVTRTAEGDAFEALRLAASLAGDPRCTPALSAGVEAVSGFVHPAFHPAPTIERLPSAEERPVIVSRYTPARRVIDLLADAQATGRPITTSTTLFIVREVLSAVRALHAHGPGVFHGAIGPERVLVTPDLQVLVVEHALGPMLAAVAAGGAGEVVRRCGIPVPDGEDRPSFSALTDQYQIALVGLALLVGRRIGHDECPHHLATLLDGISEIDLVGRPSPLDPLLREWFARALLVSDNGPFPDLEAAEGDLALLLSDDTGHVAAPLGLEIEPEALVPMLPAPARRKPAIAGADTPKATRLRLAPPPIQDSSAASDERRGPVVGEVCGFEVDLQEPEQASASAEAKAPSSAQPTKPAIFLPEIDGVAPDPAAAGHSLLRLATTLEAGGRTQGAKDAAQTDGAEVVPEPGLMGRWRLRSWPLHLLIAGATIGIVLMSGVMAGGYYLVLGRRPAQLVVESVPPGVAVLRDGQEVGRTPLTLSLPRGGHYFELRGAYSSQALSVLLHAGEQRRERVELPEAGTPGTLVVLTEPPGVPVRIDEQVRGEAPLTVNIAPGRHIVSAANEVAMITREIVMDVGGKIDLALPVSGWIEIVSPVPVQTTVSDRPVPPGTSRIASATGRFRVECVNEVLGLRDVQDVLVEAGRTTQVAVAGTSGLLDITADVADAAVWIDGKLVGRVPLNSVAVPLGPHEIRFVHPKRGEVRYQVDVGMGANRLTGEFGTMPQGVSGYGRRR